MLFVDLKLGETFVFRAGLGLKSMTELEKNEIAHKKDAAIVRDQQEESRIRFMFFLCRQNQIVAHLDNQSMS